MSLSYNNSILAQTISVSGTNNTSVTGVLTATSGIFTSGINITSGSGSIYTSGDNIYFLNSNAGNLWFIGDQGGGNNILSKYQNATTGPYMFFRKYRGSFSSPSIVASGDNLGSIQFETMNYDGTITTQCARIQASTEAAPASGLTNLASQLRFFTSTSSNVFNAPTQRMVITSNGLVGINTTTPVSTLDVSGLITSISGNFTQNLQVNGTGVSISGHTHTASQISDSTAVGRTLLTAADAATQRTSLGLGSLATQNGTFSGTSSGTNTGDQTISIGGDVTASGGTGALTATVTKINGVALSGLSTGLLKNTTSTGAPTIAIAGTDYAAASHTHTSSSITDFNTAVSGLVNGVYAPLSGATFSGTIVASSIAGNAALNSVMDGRLNLVSNDPTADSSSATLYYTPYSGNRISLYDNVNNRWKIHTFTEISIPLTGLTTQTVYDIFIYDNNGTKTLEFSTAWTNTKNRELGPTYSWTTNGNNYLQDGVYVKTGATNKRYIGTIFMTSGGLCANTTINRHLWNMYNRINVLINPTVYGVVNWTYNSSTWRILGGAAARAEGGVDIVVGQAGDIIDITTGCLMAVPTTSCYALLALTVNGAMLMDGGTRSNTVGQNQLYANYKISFNSYMSVGADYINIGVGRHVFEAYEARAGTGTYSGFGGTGNGSYFGGTFAQWRC